MEEGPTSRKVDEGEFPEGGCCSKDSIVPVLGAIYKNQGICGKCGRIFSKGKGRFSLPIEYCTEDELGRQATLRKMAVDPGKAMDMWGGW